MSNSRLRLIAAPPVCHEGDAQGYTVDASAGSKRGQKFVIGDGNKMANDGQVRLNLQTTIGESTNDISSTFQVAKVSRRLMFVGKICDNNMDVLLDQTKANVLTRAGHTI